MSSKTRFDGREITDVSLDEGGYNYYSFVGEDGRYTILRETTDLTEYRLYIGQGDYDAKWAIHSGLQYKRTDQFSAKNG